VQRVAVFSGVAARCDGGARRHRRQRRLRPALLGDSELVGFFCSVAVFAFLPGASCAARASSSISWPALPHGRATVDAVMGIAFTGVAAVLAWRLLGQAHRVQALKRSMFLQLPEW
jgi:hypothetical protein